MGPAAAVGGVRRHLADPHAPVARLLHADGGRGSAVWKSTDGGESWRRLAGGLPEGQVGRIGVAVPRGSAGRTVYALVQVYSATGAAGRPAGSGLYRSDDAGDSWRLVNPDGSLASGYFGRLWVSPRDPRRIWLSGQSLRESRDAGATFVVARGSPGGDDYHALWVDPADDRRLITGADQGAAVSLNGGESWSSWYNQPTGQFYHLAADDRFPITSTAASRTTARSQSPAGALTA